jgi:hypothetical protein
MSGTVFGYAPPTSANSEYNATHFLVQSILARIGTATLAQVQSVTNTGGVSAVGFVNVLPLINQVDGSGNATPHTTVYNLPYFRVQGGTNAVILDPQVGDIGIVVFASRDISTVKSTKAQANPGSRRTFDMADGIYIGGVLNGQPQQFIQFNTSGITLSSPNQITITAPTVTINGATTIAGSSLTVNANTATTGTLTNNNVDVGSPHRHPGVQTGTGITGTPE